MSVDSTKIFAAYKLDEATGVFSDSAGDYHLTRFNNLGVSSGKHGNAATFPSNNNSLARYAAYSVGSGDPFIRDFRSEDLSIWGWCYLDDYSTYGDIVSLRDSGNSQDLIRLRLSPEELYFQVGGATTTSTDKALNTGAFDSVDIWSLFLLTYNNVTNTITVRWRNSVAGNLSTTQAYTGVAPPASASSLRIGRYSSPDYIYSLSGSTKIDSLCFSSEHISESQFNDDLWNSGDGASIDSLLSSAGGSKCSLLFAG